MHWKIQMCPGRTCLQAKYVSFDREIEIKLLFRGKQCFMYGINAIIGHDTDVTNHFYLLRRRKMANVLNLCPSDILLIIFIGFITFL